MVFGGYRITFLTGQEPIYLQIAWPTDTHPDLPRLAYQTAIENNREKLAGLVVIAAERREYKGLTFELRLYGRPGFFSAEPIVNLDPVEWPEEL